MLIAVGLVLALAVNVDVTGVDLEMIGWILTTIGAIGLVVALVLLATSRSRVGGERIIREEERPPPP